MTDPIHCEGCGCLLTPRISDEGLSLLEAAEWVVSNWDRQATQHLSMPALRAAVREPGPTPEPEVPSDLPVQSSPDPVSAAKAIYLALPPGGDLDWEATKDAYLNAARAALGSVREPGPVRVGDKFIQTTPAPGYPPDELVVTGFPREAWASVRRRHGSWMPVQIRSLLNPELYRRVPGPNVTEELREAAEQAVAVLASVHVNVKGESWLPHPNDLFYNRIIAAENRLRAALEAALEGER